jgi:hypothetical protein
LLAIIGCGARRQAVRVLFRTRLRAGSRVVRARRAHCFVCRQRVMSHVSARHLHAVVLFARRRLSFACSATRLVRVSRVLFARVSARRSHCRAVSCVVRALCRACRSQAGVLFRAS